MTYETFHIDLDDIEANLVESIIDYIQATDKMDYPKDPLTPREVIRKNLFRQPEGKVKYQSIIIDKIENKVIAFAHISILIEDHPEFFNQRHIAKFDLSAKRGFTHLAIIEDLFISILKRTKNYDYVTRIEGCNIWEDEWNLWEKYGADHVDTIDVNRLYFDEVDWDLMNQWIEEGRKNAKDAGINLLLFEECPDELLEDFVDLYTEIGNIIPNENEEKDEEVFLETTDSRRGREELRKNLGEIWLTAVSKERDGKLSGLTEIICSPSETHVARQLLTGVKPQFRGRGLGKWLKAEMLFHIKEKIPEVLVIHTGNSEINSPMSSINKSMGFRTVLTVKCFSINIEKNPLESSIFH
jgi:GNAT superfamily N-acetyltransferase